jgi:hypothetical protein
LMITVLLRPIVGPGPGFEWSIENAASEDIQNNKKKVTGNATFIISAKRH